MKVAEILTAFESDQPRTIEEFCATQPVDADYEQNSLDAGRLSNSPELSNANERIGVAGPSSDSQ